MELILALERAQQTFGRARLDIASWTNTGMVRGNNEDAVTVVHASDMGEATVEDWAVIALADGMGGNAAGEVASALTVHTVRSVLRSPPLCGLGEESGPLPGSMAHETITECLNAGLRDANRAVYLAGRCDGRRGMGCTAEAVFVDGRQIIVAHVGDSRTYLFSRGTLRQLTRDQTFLARLFEQGQITPEEAGTASPPWRTDARHRRPRPTSNRKMLARLLAREIGLSSAATDCPPGSRLR